MAQRAGLQDVALTAPAVLVTVPIELTMPLGLLDEPVSKTLVTTLKMSVTVTVTVCGGCD